MIDKVSFSAPQYDTAYNYKMNNASTKETINTVVKESKSKSKKFDWSDIEKLMEFVKKTNSAEDRIIVGDMKKFTSGTRETMRNQRMEKEQEHIAKPVSERTAYNTKQLKSAGVRNSDVKDYLTYDGHVNSEGKKILKENGKSYK